MCRRAHPAWSNFLVKSSLGGFVGLRFTGTMRHRYRQRLGFRYRFRVAVGGRPRWYYVSGVVVRYERSQGAVPAVIRQLKGPEPDRF
jgi:hypothetical protein